VLEIEIEAVRLGTTSFTCRATFRKANAERILTTVETVYVLVEANALTKTPLPVSFRDALESGARGRLVDHAAHAAATTPQT
jgi:acyl-CoA thioester hydrolase